MMFMFLLNGYLGSDTRYFFNCQSEQQESWSSKTVEASFSLKSYYNWRQSCKLDY